MNASSVDCTIVIPAFNAAKYLPMTLESLLAAGNISIEIIVVDDGSTDDTTSLVAKMMRSHANISYLKKTNSGVSNARNAGLSLVTSAYVCFLDADDCVRPDGLAAMHRMLIDHPEAVAAYGDVGYLDEGSKKQNNYSTDKRPSIVTLDTALQSNFIDTPGAVLFRTAAVVKAGAFDAELRMGEDWELYVRVARQGPFLYCGKTVINYRLHSSSAMHNKQLTMKDFEPMLTKVFRDHPEKYSIDPTTLNLLEVRMRAALLRLILLRSKGAICQLQNLFRMSRMVLDARLDSKVLKITAKSLPSAIKRIF